MKGRRSKVIGKKKELVEEGQEEKGYEEELVMAAERERKRETLWGIWH